MTDSKTTKRSLAASVGCMALCVVLLVGTTFAWFTDTATTSVSKVQAGTLDVAIVDADGAELTGGLSFQKASGHTDEAVLWEPGATYKTQGFKIENNGSLALKYQLTLNGVTGDSDLLDVIKFSVVKVNVTSGEETEIALDSYEGNLAADDMSETLYIKGTMSADAGNKYQNKSLSGISLSVAAAQYTSEYDSYNNTYDEKATYATPVSTADALKTAIANGEDVRLTADVELPAAVSCQT